MRAKQRGLLFGSPSIYSLFRFTYTYCSFRLNVLLSFSFTVTASKTPVNA